MRELMSLWRTMRADPTTFGTLMDTFPTHLEDWLLPCDENTMYVWLIMFNGEVAGAHWIHDWGLWDCPDSAWAAGYLLPSFRGTTGAAPLQLMRDYALDMGVKHLFTAIRTTNAASIRWCSVHCGMMTTIYFGIKPLREPSTIVDIRHRRPRAAYC